MLHTFFLQTRRTTRRSLAAARIVASNDDPLHRPVRRSQRAHTPTRYLMSELPSRRRRSMTPKKEEKKEKVEKNATEDDEEEGEPSEVERSEYELRSNFPTTPRRSPRRKDSIHYFNSELPQHRQHQLKRQQPTEKGWIAEDSKVSTTTHQLRSAVTKHTTVSPTVALSSDEESQEMDENSVIPRISLYESKMRKRLKNLSNLTKKKVSEALTSLSTKETKPAAEERAQPGKPVQSSRSQQPKLPPVPSTHGYETRSRTARSRQTQSSQPPITTMQLRSSQDLDHKEKEKVTSQPPPLITSSRLSQGPLVPDPQPGAPPQDEIPQQPPYPQWMELGWAEVITTVIVLGLILFAYYCFSSESC